MGFSVNTNGNALAALRTLNTTQTTLNTIQARINSGLKVASAKDDASTFAIAQGLRGDIAGFKAISDAISFGQATVNVASNAAQSVSDTLNQIKSKVTAAQAENVDRAAIQKDVDALIAQVNSITDAAQFNGVNLISANASGTDNLVVLSSLNRSDASSAPTAFNITVDHVDLSAGGLSIQNLNVKSAGQAFTASSTNFTLGNTISLVSGGTTTTFQFISTTTDSLADSTNVAVLIGSTTNATLSTLISKATQNGYTASYNSTGAIVFANTKGDVTASATLTGGNDGGTFAIAGTASAVSGALSTIETAINSVKTALADLGTKSTQLTTQGNFVKSLTDTLTEGVGTLVDADLAEESANLQAAQTRQQLGIQALSIANQGPGAVLSLFR